MTHRIYRAIKHKLDKILCNAKNVFEATKIKWTEMTAVAQFIILFQYVLFHFCRFNTL